MSTKEYALNIVTFKRSLTDRIAMELENIVDTVEYRIENEIQSAADIDIVPRIERAVRSVTSSSGRYVANVATSSEHEQQTGITTPVEITCDGNNAFHECNLNDKTRVYNSDHACEFPVVRTHLDRQLYSHHSSVKERSYISL